MERARASRAPQGQQNQENKENNPRNIVFDRPNSIHIPLQCNRQLASFHITPFPLQRNRQLASFHITPWRGTADGFCVDAQGRVLLLASGPLKKDCDPARCHGCTPFSCW